MQNITTAQKNHLFHGGAVGVTITGETLGGDPINLNEDDIIEGTLTIERNWAHGSVIEIGCSDTSELIFELDNFEGQWSDLRWEGARLTVVFDIDGEPLQAGIFTVDEPPRRLTTMQIRALDDMARFNRPYSAGIVFPAPLGQILLDCCSQCNVTLHTVSFDNDDYVVSQAPQGDDITFHHVVAWVAELAGCNAWVDELARLQLTWYGPEPEDFFTFDAESQTITDYDTAGGLDVVIPAMIGGVPVLYIGVRAFFNKGLTGAAFPDGLLGIEVRAFRSNGIPELILPDSTERIEAFAFTGNPIVRAIMPADVNISALAGTLGDYNLEAFYLDNGSLAGEYTYDSEAEEWSYEPLSGTPPPPALSVIGPDDRWSYELAEADIEITGISHQIVIEGEDDEGDQEVDYLAGTDDYALVIEDNPLLQESFETVLSAIYDKLGGFTYRPLKFETIGYPHLWPGDMIPKVIDAEGVEHRSIITNHLFTLNGKSLIEARGETETVKGYATGAPFTPKQQRVLKGVARIEAARRTSNIEQATLALNELMVNSLGYYSTTHTLPTGAKITYTHDRPLLEESQIIWTRTEQGFAWTDEGWNEGDPVWQYGVTADGSMVARLLDVIGVRAEWITVGSGSTFEEGYDPTEVSAEVKSLADGEYPDGTFITGKSIYTPEVYAGHMHGLRGTFHDLLAGNPEGPRIEMGEKLIAAQAKVSRPEYAFASRHEEGYGPEKAFDGDTETYWLSGTTGLFDIVILGQEFPEPVCVKAVRAYGGSFTGLSYWDESEEAWKPAGDLWIDSIEGWRQLNVNVGNVYARKWCVGTSSWLGWVSVYELEFYDERFSPFMDGYATKTQKAFELNAAGIGTFDGFFSMDGHPAGVIHELSSNAGGGYVKWSNGWATCFADIGSQRVNISNSYAGSYRSDQQEQMLPVEFVSTLPFYHNASQAVPGNEGIWVTGGGSATAWRWRANRMTSGTNVLVGVVRLFAAGWWKEPGT